MESPTAYETDFSDPYGNRYGIVVNQFLNWLTVTPHRGVTVSHSIPSGTKKDRHTSVSVFFW